MSGQVDLSVARIGDECHLRDGRRIYFGGQSPEDSKHHCTHPYIAERFSYQQDGTFSLPGNPPHVADIVRVTRDGVQITPAVEPEPGSILKEKEDAEPSAGPGPSVQELYRYSSGETPEIGDLVESPNGPQFTVKLIDSRWLGFHEDRTPADPCWRFKLLRRASSPSPPESVQSFSVRNRQRCEASTGFNHRLDSWSLSDWMTATLGELGEAANVVKKMNRVRDGIPGNGATELDLRVMLADELADAYCYLDLMIQAAGFDKTEIVESKFRRVSERIGYQDANHRVHPQNPIAANHVPDAGQMVDAPAVAVITGPGKYRTDDDEADKLDYSVEIVGRGSDGRWYGLGASGPDSWDDNGVSHRWPHDYGNVTEPFVPPPPPPAVVLRPVVDANGELWSCRSRQPAPCCVLHDETAFEFDELLTQIRVMGFVFSPLLIQWVVIPAVAFVVGFFIAAAGLDCLLPPYK